MQATPDQLRAIQHTTGPCLVVAGAGTGKTSVITQRIARLILEEGVAPSRILALTFTEKAAAEMEERLDELLPYGTFGVRVSTFHAYARELLPKHAFRVGIDPNAALASDAEVVSVLRENLDRFRFSHLKPGLNPVSLISKLHELNESLLDAGLEPEDYQALADTQESEASEELREIGICLRTLRVILDEQRIITQGRLMSFLNQLSKIPHAMQEERELTPYVLVDEFQDTNDVQAAYCYALAGEHGNLFVVGDDDQSIYRFRGANVENILGFTAHFPSANVITLRDNFRSTQPILDAAYRLITNNNPHRLETRLGINKRLVSSSPSTTPVEHLFFEHELQEVAGVSQRIAALISEGVPPEEIAVLARSNAALDRFEVELGALGILTARAKQQQLLSLEGPRETLAFLRFLTEPTLSSNLYNLLNGEPFRVSSEALLEAATLARRLREPLWKHLNGELRSFLESQLNRNYRSSTEAIRAFVRETRWEQALIAENRDDILQRLNSFYREAQAFERLHPGATIFHYVRHTDALIETGAETSVREEPEGTKGAVQLLSIHISKGLEFHTVFLTQMVRGRFPSATRGSGLPLLPKLKAYTEDQVAHEEERRLAYVAVTRAKSQLYLTSAKRYSGNKTDKQPSLFLSELLEEISHVPEQVTLSETFAVRHMPPRVASRAMPSAISASALEAFEDDPQRYLREHVFHTIEEPSAHTTFGTSVHAAIYAGLLAQQAGLPFNASEYVAEHFDPYGYEGPAQRAEYLMLATDAVRNYLTAHPAHPATRLEQPVSYRVSANLKIIGKIDRIEQSEDGLHIIDYKTGKVPARTPSNLPLAIYALALQQQGEHVSGLELSYVVHAKQYFFTVTEEYLQNAAERVATLVAALTQAYETGVFEKQD